MSTYTYPIVLRNMRLGKFKIDDSISIRRIKKSEKERFFGLSKVEYEFRKEPGLVIGWVCVKKFHSSGSRAKYQYSDILNTAGALERGGDIFASEYVVEFDPVEPHDIIVENLNLAFRLFSPTSTCCFIGFHIDGSQMTMHYNNGIGGPFNYLNLRKVDLIDIKNLYKLVKSRVKDKKFNLVSNLYTRSMLGDSALVDIRFLLLTIALESLYLPVQDTELNFRLSLRVSKMLENKEINDIDKIFKKIKEIYTVRSKLVHSGDSKGLSTGLYSQLTEVVRLSLLKYLNDSEAFKEEALTGLILK